VTKDILRKEKRTSMNPRILIFSTAYFPLVGGAEVAMKELTDRMPDARFHLVCAKIRPGLASVEKIGNVTVHRVGFGHPVDKLLLPLLGVIETFTWKDVSLVWSLMASYGGFAALAYTWFHPRANMLLTLQEGDPLEHYDKRTGWLHFLHRMIFKRANAVQPISRFLGDWAVRMGFSGTPNIIPNGVDVAGFSAPVGQERRAELRRRHAFADTDTVVVTVV
jgi:glycosyltransferase involved in cell wall biosynthesis